MFYIAGIVKEEDGSGYSVYFPDVPTVCAGGATVEEAIENATSGLHLALKFMAESNTEPPSPSSLEVAREKVKAERAEDNLPYPEDTLYQYIQAPELNMIPVRINISIPKGALQEIDQKAKLAGFTRSGFLTKAALAYDI